VTTSAAVAVTIANSVVQFSDLYTQIFASTGTGHCANCHTGGGATLPAALNLSSAANAYAAVVDVASIQRPTLARVASGNPAGSYLINKLEGVDIGNTNRMPFGGPFLDQTTIDSVKAWIAQGALNN
jgi:mono/diheme cytochrome c family protein